MLSADVEQNHCDLSLSSKLPKDLVEEGENGEDFSIP